MPGATLTEGGNMPKDGLTRKQKAFCENYIANGGNATQAAIDAGYKPNSAKSVGSENLSKPDIAAYIGELSKPTEEKRIASAEEVLEYLTMVVDAKKKELRGEAAETVKTADANKAADLLGKFHQLYVERIKVDDDSGITIKVVDL
jgi:phage terminase small subunit